MTEFCEGVEPPAIEKEGPRTDDKTPVKVRCIMLFDGTMNNKVNIASRESKDQFYQASISKWSKAKYAVASVFNKNAEPPKGGDSYENGYTNIVTLDKHIETKPTNGYDLVIKVYTEGAGTIDNKKDKLTGYAIGAGEAGVIKKCEKGIFSAITQIMNSTLESTGKSIDPTTQYIEKLTIDVFGFSRGAATARYCIHKVLNDDKWQIKKRLESFQIETKNVQIWFAGLFDTVSSHGLSFSNDVRALELDAVVHAAKTLHLVAAEEYRKNFSITNIKSAKGGEEYFLPGVHSDVGGSYLKFSNEEFDLNSGKLELIEKDKATLIAEGWYTKDEIEEYIAYDEGGYPLFARISAIRKGISNAYCNIPLKLMAKGAKNQKIDINPQLDTDATEAINEADSYFGNKDLSTLDKAIFSYMTTSIEAFMPLIYEPLLIRIRHSYLHMSSKDEIGLAPRFKDGKRWRQYYDG